MMSPFCIQIVLHGTETRSPSIPSGMGTLPRPLSAESSLEITLVAPRKSPPIVNGEKRRGKLS
jgi:hypothetical protein